MSLAVDLQNELAFMTREVREERPDRVLAAELEPGEAPAAELPP
jgi:hypothetical protein